IPSDSAILKDREVLLDFCDKPQPNLLVFHVNAAGNLTSSTAFPSSLKTKACFFAKKISEPLPREPKEKIADALSYGDLSSAALEQLQIYVNDVIVPLLSTPRNHEDWPEVVSSDIQKHVSDLQSQIQVVNSLVKGKILLPYPKYPKPISAKSDNIPTSVRSVEAIDLKFVHAVESVVIEWSHQIREVLKKDSSQPILEGQNPFPAVELEFWKAKRANLESIFEQLNDPRVSKMGELLAKSNSSYHPAFIHLHGEVRQALDEAQDIDTHLRPLASHFESIETADFPDTKQLYKPCFHIIALLWANCRHYTVPSRIIILLQELCNLVMKQASKYLEPMELFKGEVDEALEKIEQTIDCLQVFRDEYEDVRTNIKRYFKTNGQTVKDWDFSPTLVFARWNRFAERVNIIKELFSTANAFLKLEKVEIGGVKG
ncbi:unnamed protein product, partial [Didymodactylos carnosus]